MTAAEDLACGVLSGLQTVRLEHAAATAIQAGLRMRAYVEARWTPTDIGGAR